MASNKKYWSSVEELKDSSIVETLQGKEFVEEIPTDEFLGDKQTLEKSSTSRRDFLKYIGFSTAAASLAACQGPVRKSIPYVVKPDDTILGVSDWYASTMADGYDFANVLVKTSEGRPILIMPNKEAGGSTNARVQASVLSLYDDKLRVKEPSKNAQPISWDSANAEISAALNNLKDANEYVVLLTGTLASPSTEKIIKDFTLKYTNVKHVVYDAISESGAVDAFEVMYGKRALPSYHLDKAKTIVSIGADFLGDWHGGFDKQYAAGRKPETGRMSHHTQIESNMSISGANADKRYVVKPSDQVYALLNLYNALTGASLTSKPTAIDKQIKEVAYNLQKAATKSVVLCGLNDKNAQLITYAINNVLNSEIIDVTNTLNIRQGNDKEVQSFVKDVKEGKVAGLITYNIDPLYTLPTEIILDNLKLNVAIATDNNLTTSKSTYVLPANHYLESWGDVKALENRIGLMQPAIQTLFNTKQFQDILLTWSGNTTSYYAYLIDYWNTEIADRSSWIKAVHDGFINIDVKLSEDAKEIFVPQIANELFASVKPSEFELNLFSSTALGDGKMANNPWLQELPDPITRASWDNYLTVSMADAKKLGFSNPVKDNGAIDGNYANVTVNGIEIKNIPVMIQPGQAIGSVGLALGYGRKYGLKEEMQVGVNAYPFYAKGNNIQYNVTVKKADGWHQFASMQVQKTLAGRNDILKVATLAEVSNKSLDPKHTWNKPAYVSYDHQEVEAKTIDLWDEHNRELGHHFNLSIDLTSCTGCGACVIACHAENNVPVVGKDEMRVGRDMHWLRIDRYYSSRVEDEQKTASMTMEEFKAQNPKLANQEVERKYAEKVLELSKGDLFDALENSAENPEVTFQPMMCQHCNHAPCETVCPVGATAHGRQGQNQMAYNRCVGTRYCANNCPYRVRRFNWFNYADNDEFDFNMNSGYGKMVLNPDVTVRARGVMEKCSFCIQTTQAVILKAKREGRTVGKDEFDDACACSAACSTGAMVFGDVNNQEDKIVPLTKDKRAYHVLDYIGTKPNVVYQVKVRNTNEA